MADVSDFVVGFRKPNGDPTVAIKHMVDAHTREILWLIHASVNIFGTTEKDGMICVKGMDKGSTLWLSKESEYPQVFARLSKPGPTTLNNYRALARLLLNAPLQELCAIWPAMVQVRRV